MPAENNSEFKELRKNEKSQGLEFGSFLSTFKLLFHEADKWNRCTISSYNTYCRNLSPFWKLEESPVCIEAQSS